MSEAAVRVSPMASRPWSILALREASIWKAKTLPEGEVTVWAARSTLTMWLPPRHSPIRSWTSSGLRTTGRSPFWKQLL